MEDPLWARGTDSVPQGTDVWKGQLSPCGSSSDRWTLRVHRAGSVYPGHRRPGRSSPVEGTETTPLKADIRGAAPSEPQLRKAEKSPHFQISVASSLNTTCNQFQKYARTSHYQVNWQESLPKSVVLNVAAP